MSEEPKADLICLSCGEEHASPYHCPSRTARDEPHEVPQYGRPVKRVDTIVPFILRGPPVGPDETTRVTMPHHFQVYRPITLLMRKQDREAFNLFQLNLGGHDLFKNKAPLWLGATDRLDWMPAVQIAIDHVWWVTNISNLPCEFRGALLIHEARG